MTTLEANSPRGMRTFLIVWLGEMISLVGSGLTSFALGVWIYDQTGQATPFALTVLFGTLPRLLFSPLAGSLADRWNRRLVMIAADCGAALATGAAAALLIFGDLQIWHIYLIALVSSVFSAFQEPAYAASIPMLVSKENLGRANGLMQIGQSIGTLASPLLAGLLFLTIGLKGIILIDFVTFFAAVGALLIVRIPQPVLPPEEPGQKPSVWKDALLGWRFFTTRPGLMGLLMYFALVNFLLNISAVLMTPMILSTSSPSALGAVQAAMGVGMLAGSIVLSVWGGPRRKRVYAVIGFIMLGGVGFLITGAGAAALFPGVGLFVLLFAVPLGSGASQVIFQTKTPLEMQGRVFAVRGMISQSIMPLAFLLAGPLADRVFEPLMAVDGPLGSSWLGALIGAGPGRGIGLMFILSAVLLGAASLGALANPRIRNVEEELADALPETNYNTEPGAGEPALEIGLVQP